MAKGYIDNLFRERIGNSVCPPVATALVRANAADMIATRELKTVKELNDYMLAS